MRACAPHRGVHQLQHLLMQHKRVDVQELPLYVFCSSFSTSGVASAAEPREGGTCARTGKREQCFNVRIATHLLTVSLAIRANGHRSRARRLAPGHAPPGSSCQPVTVLGVTPLQVSPGCHLTTWPLPVHRPTSDPPAGMEGSPGHCPPPWPRPPRAARPALSPTPYYY